MYKSISNRSWLSPSAVIFTLDCMAFVVAFVFSVCFWHVYFKGVEFSFYDLSAAVGLARLVIYIALVIFAIALLSVHYHHYGWRKPFWGQLRELWQLIIFLAILDLAITSIAKLVFSRGMWLTLWLSLTIIMPLFRWAGITILNRFGYWIASCVIIGCGEHAKGFYQALKCEGLMGLEVVAFIPPSDGKYKSPVDQIPLWVMDKTQVAEKLIDCKLYIAVEPDQIKIGDDWIRHLIMCGVRNVSIVPPMQGIPLHDTDMSYFFSHQLISFQLRNNLNDFSSRIIKRSFDVVVSLTLLLLLSPVMLLLSWWVSRDGGAVLFGHKRVGHQGEMFSCLKFRTMVPDADSALASLLANNEQARIEWNSEFKLKVDPRITPIGHFLRRSSLDELPQLWNVLKGDMSLVGPRPIIKDELTLYGEDVQYYLMAKPGITGLWQISGRNDVNYATRVLMDSWYVKNWSLWYDVAILLKTINVVFHRNGAY